MSPEATFDTLAIVCSLEPTLGRVLHSEIHLFAYLSCLLSLYNGQPVSEWGYSFASTADGSPFAPSLADALRALRGSGDLDGTADGFTPSPSGRDEWGVLRSLSQNASRELYISGACASVLALPVGVVRSAMSREPALRRVASLGTRQLLEKVDVAALYEQFGALTSAIGSDVREFMVPAVTWLTYLVRAASTEENVAMPELTLT